MSIESYWIKINGVVLPTPMKCPITEYDMHGASSGRDEAARMHIDMVRTNLADLDLEWDGLTPQQALTIRNAIAPTEFSVEVHFLGQSIYFTGYKGDRKWDPDFGRNSSGTVERWNLSMKIIAS